MIKGNDDDFIYINVLEGSHLALPEANKGIGFMEIRGTQIKRDIAKGSDIEITISISESRDITVSAFILIWQTKSLNKLSIQKKDIRQLNFLKNKLKIYQKN
jgi:molecular chaperone DnaK